MLLSIKSLDKSFKSWIICSSISVVITIGRRDNAFKWKGWYCWLDCTGSGEVMMIDLLPS